MTAPLQPELPQDLIHDHRRAYASNRYVYPVLSRRAGGISIGVNLNLDKICNFDCVYCQVNRGEPGEKDFVDQAALRRELDVTVALVVSGRLFETPRFADVPQPLRRLNDIALSGDGEPTTFRNFEEVVSICAAVRRDHQLAAVKIVLITNASMLHRDNVRRGLAILDSANGEIWAKLDAGTDAYFRAVARSKIPFQRILDNLADAAQRRPIVIQSLFMRLNDRPPPIEEIEAYCARLGEIVAGGGKIHRVQLHTVARPPAESWVSALSNGEIDALAEIVQTRTGLPVARYYGK
jgi:wyosine [tRNA(Phe)-imidazoG37] synthetase (radical SAM superfamily)